MRSLIILAMGASSSAWAADCPTPYTIDGLLADLTGVESALRTGSDGDAAAAGLRLRDGLGCLDEILPAPIAARSYRAVGAGLYSKGDPDGATRWFKTALELEPTWDYGVQDLPEGHPLRSDFDALKLTLGGEPVPVSGKEFGPGTHYLDGRKITSPKARTERFHVYQVDGSGVSSAVIDGNAFPASNLVAAATTGGADTAKAPKEKKDKTATGPSEKELAKAEADRKKAAEKAAAAAKSKTRVGPDGTVYYERVRPKEKTPLLIAGGAIMASAGVIYYAADRTNARMKGISTIWDVNPDLPPDGPFDVCGPTDDPASGCAVTPSDELDRLLGVTNRLVVASVAVFAVGVGTTTWGVLVDGGTAMPTVNIRF